MSTILELQNIIKNFPGVQALKGINLKINKGEIHALLGENGAGKSTLIKIICGVYPATEGQILINGEKVRITNPADAQKNGIAVIHQEFNLFPNLDVRENIVFYLDLNKYSFRKLNWNEINAKANKVLKMMDVSLPLHYKLRYLNVANQQLVEIAKALILNAKILIMDEPTAALTESEIERLFKIIKKLKDQGVTIIYISHRLGEIMEIADRVSILRDGDLIATKEISLLNEQAIAQMITGKEAKKSISKKPNESVRTGRTVLEVKNLTRPPYYSDLNFSLKSGEVLGILGPLGAGKTELGLSLFGILKPARGKILLDGKEVDISSPTKAMNYRIAYVPEDRQRYGMIQNMPVIHNLTISILKQINNLGFIDKKRQTEIANQYIKLLNIKTPHLYQTIDYLSGGNAQKTIIGRWLASQPKILILDQPTRGLDVGAKTEVREIVRDLAKKDFSIMFLSMEVPEIMEVCDRIIILREGLFIRELKPQQTSQEELTAITLGVV